MWPVRWAGVFLHTGRRLIWHILNRSLGRLTNTFPRKEARMRAKILRQAGGAQNRDSVCLVCGAGKGGSDEGRRRLKTLLEVELGCGYKAEMYMCSYCYGKDSEFRGGSIEIPDVEHFHIQGSQHKTWFDFGDIVNWLK